MKEYLTIRELWLMAMAWNEAIVQMSYRHNKTPEISDWLNKNASAIQTSNKSRELTVRQALAKNAPRDTEK